MNIIVQNRRNVEFDLADLEVQVKDFIEDNNVIFYLIEVRLLAQIWILKKRFSDFDKMHTRLKADLEFRAAENLPDLPPKKLFFNKNQQFVKDRMRALNRYQKNIILIYEAIENPILQRFLEIDTNFNPNYEYETIDVGLVDDISDVSSLFLEGDKLSKIKKQFEQVKAGKQKKFTKHEEQERFMLQQFNNKDLPNHRFYNPMIEAPFSDPDYSSEYLDEFHGFESLDFSREEQQQQPENILMPLAEQEIMEDSKERLGSNMFSGMEEEEKGQYSGRGTKPLGISNLENNFFKKPYKQSSSLDYDQNDQQYTQQQQQNFQDLEADFQVNDEYEQIDETKCTDQHKLQVKKASKACNKLIKENSELFRLNYKINEMGQELDEMDLYFNDLNTKILDRCALIKKIMANPTKLHKIKKNQIVHAIQQEIDNEVEDQAYLTEGEYNNSEPSVKQKFASIPTVSTGIYNATNLNNKLAARNNKFI